MLEIRDRDRSDQDRPWRDALKARRERTRKKRQRRNRNRIFRHPQTIDRVEVCGGGQGRQSDIEEDSMAENDSLENDENQTPAGDRSPSPEGLRNEQVIPAILFGIRKDPLSYLEALAILTTANPERISAVAPERPKGGEMYLLAPDQHNDHTADGYRFKGGGFNKLPSAGNHKIDQRNLKILTESSDLAKRRKLNERFRKFLWKLPNCSNSPLLVHYVGDERVFKEISHGNATKNADQPFHQTAKVIATKAKASIGKLQAQEAYDEILAESRPELPYQPRNRKQVENFQYAARCKNQISHDNLYNLYLLGFEFPDYIVEHRADFRNDNNMIYLASQPLLMK